HRNTEDGAKAAQLSRLIKSVIGIRLHIGNMNDLSLEQGSSYRRAPFRFDRHIFHKLGKLIRASIGRGQNECSILFPRDASLVEPAEPGGCLEQRLQHSL